MSHPYVWASTSSPAALDHIILGCENLDTGIAFVEERTGVRAVFGGVHPGHGTQNALMSLGRQRYLEILAPDPKQENLNWFHMLPTLNDPRLVGWVAHTDDAAVVAMELRKARIMFDGPNDGSRIRPDSRTLRWRKIDLIDDRHGVLPSFIQWTADSVHPSEDAPSGCSLVRLEAVSPDPEELRTKLLGVDLPIVQGEKTLFRARIVGPKGALDLISY